MLVSHMHRFIFLKPKKTAGTSVEMWLEPLCAPPGHIVREGTDELVSDYGIIGCRSSTAKHDRTFWNHIPGSELRDLLGVEIFDAYLKIATVRNPFDMLVSAFHHVRLPADRLEGMAPNDVFDSFRAWAKGLAEPFFSNLPLLMVDGKPCIDVAIRYEHHEEDTVFLLNKLGIDPINLGPLPSTKRKFRPRSMALHQYYDEETTALVLRHAEKDFELFGYAAVVPMEPDSPYQAACESSGVFTGVARQDKVDDRGNWMLYPAPTVEHVEHGKLVVAILREIAAIEGKRRPDGTWVDGTPGDVQSLLRRAFEIVGRSTSA